MCGERPFRTSPATAEIVIWDNGSTDGTDGFLSGLSDPRVRLVRTGSNVGMVAYGRAFALTSSPYLIQLDDDVVDAPDSWDATLLEAFERLEGFGYLATDVADDPMDRLSHERHRVHRYDDVVVNRRTGSERPHWGLVHDHVTEHLRRGGRLADA